MRDTCAESESDTNHDERDWDMARVRRTTYGANEVKIGLIVQTFANTNNDH